VLSWLCTGLLLALCTTLHLLIHKMFIPGSSNTTSRDPRPDSGKTHPLIRPPSSHRLLWVWVSLTLCLTMEPHLHFWISPHSEMFLATGMTSIPVSHGQSYARLKASRNFGKVLPHHRRLSRELNHILQSRARERRVNRRVLPRVFQGSPLSGVAFSTREITPSHPKPTG
jgi:hypothetical protein